MSAPSGIYFLVLGVAFDERTRNGQLFPANRPKLKDAAP
jgi:hypothetical protein